MKNNFVNYKKNVMKTSDNGLNLIKSCEGLYLKAYLCPAKVATIGYGSTRDVKLGMVITVDQAIERLKADLAPVEAYLNKSGLVLTQNQFDALVSFIFNLGEGAFDKSTLKKEIIEKDVEGIKRQWMRWINAAGKPLKGLKIRRKLELDLFLKK
jgi:lysozyme